MTGPIVVCGVSGSGKSTVGAALARRLGVPFGDADDLHSAAAVAKMTAGVPLNADDREPWLERVGAWLAAHPDGVMACSALRRSYRDRLRRAAPMVRFVALTADPAELIERLRDRPGHFMPTSLLASQLETWEPLADDEPTMDLDPRLL